MTWFTEIERTVHACSKSADNSGEVPLADEKATDENEGSGTANQIAPYEGWQSSVC